MHVNNRNNLDSLQSVEMDHPNALEFLRKDCNNVNEFFRRKNVGVLSLKGLFDFVTDPTITDENVDLYLEEAQVSCFIYATLNAILGIASINLIVQPSPQGFFPVRTCN